MLTLAERKDIQIPAIAKPCHDSFLIITAQMRIQEIISMTQVDETVQREIIEHKVKKLADYIEQGGSEQLIYLPPIILSWRNVKVEDVKYDQNKNLVHIPHDAELFISDGMHRKMALQRISKRLENKLHGEFDAQVYKNLLQLEREFLHSSLSVQLFIGLTREAERNLFVDINNHSKKVSLSKVIEFDQRDKLNILSQEVVKECTALQPDINVEMHRNSLARPGNKAFTSLARVRKMLSYMWTGYAEGKSLKQSKRLEKHFEKYLSLSVLFFNRLLSVLPGEPGNATQYVTASGPVQYALALYVHSIVKEKKYETEKEVIARRTETLVRINWSNANSIWSDLGGYYSEERGYWVFKQDRANISRIAAYLENETL